MAGANASPQHVCGMCDRQFDNKDALWDHQEYHADSAATTLQCQQCLLRVEDTFALEEHQRSAGHGEKHYVCTTCGTQFYTRDVLISHVQTYHPGRPASHCAECLVDFVNDQDRRYHQRTTGHKKIASGKAPVPIPEERRYCEYCKRHFSCGAAFSRHLFGCIAHDQTPKRAQNARLMRDNDKEKKPKRNKKTAAPATPQSAYKAANAVQTPTSSFVCKSEGCGKSFTSEAAFKNHQADIHGVGGKALDLHGKDQYILSPHMRQQLKNAGVLQASTNSPLARGEGRGTGRGSGLASSFDLHGPSTTLHPGRVTPTGSMPSPFHNAAQDASSTPGKQTAKASTSARQPLPVVSTFAEFAAMPIQQPTPGTPEIEEAKDIQVKTLPLRLQSNIFIYHDGKIFVDGKNWSRIEISKQQAVITRLNEMCGLQRYMRDEDTPVPNAFKDLYTAEYPSSDFKESPKRDPAKPGVPVVALWCSKVVLATGHEDLVKISAVDLAKGHVLINHFVCTDPTANVNDWRSKTTRLAHSSDMERARQHDFKIFLGWAAARSALWQFVDKDTLIVGHNLRSDFDALRMIHGRALDIVLIAEQVAEGPLSKAQLTLHRMVRTFCNVDIDYYRKIGQQDCPTNAFAIRELALFVVKNRRLFDENFRLRSRDYQKILSTASG